MPSVKNLKLELQKGSTNTYFATWDFDNTVNKVTSSSNIKAGDLVTILDGATYYNGTAIPNWVKTDSWYVVQVTDDRAVLGKNESGSNDIQSPINTKYLAGGSGGSTTTTSNHLDHYKVIWQYATGDGVWFNASTSDDVKIKQSTYSPPENALGIRVSVKPISKTHKVNKKDVYYWTGTWAHEKLMVSHTKPATPSAPSVTIDSKRNLTATLDNISDARTDQIMFVVYSGNKEVKIGVATVFTCRASFSYKVPVGSDYRVRCRAINLIPEGTCINGDWSDFSESLNTVPGKVKKFEYVKALTETSAGLKWEAVNGATGFEIEYTTKKAYFDSSNEVSSMTVDGVRHAEVTGLESGKEYFFRVRAVNDVGKSEEWSDIQNIILGTKPSAPTTWSSSTTIIVGEKLRLYWVHNSEDGSSQTHAEIKITYGGHTETVTVKNTTNEDKKDKTSRYVVDTSGYASGTKFQWCVRTAGITKVYGDWSVTRTVDMYTKPTLDLSVENSSGSMIDTINTFPFYVVGVAGPESQTPIGYHLVVKAKKRYETLDRVGNPTVVGAGEEVYSNYFNTSISEMRVELSASNIDLENGQNYTIECTLSMDSGLTAKSKVTITVNWVEALYEPDASIGIDTDSYSAYISPFCITETGQNVKDVELAVYRREFDGTFKEIASGIPAGANTYITDPHPSLDYARYRIVAMSKATGAISYYDPPGYPVDCPAAIIQWDDYWTNFDANGEDEMEDKPWTGSMVMLPYNLDVSDDNSPDVEMVSYIGRSHPVSYYGTQIGSTATWSVEIEADDKDTLYALRRLARWMGDVYVREPSGSGYWAHITVSFSQKHCGLTIPITLSITRVEGGV